MSSGLASCLGGLEQRGCFLFVNFGGLGNGFFLSWSVTYHTTVEACLSTSFHLCPVEPPLNLMHAPQLTSAAAKVELPVRFRSWLSPPAW
jgi:hypothetical protein